MNFFKRYLGCFIGAGLSVPVLYALNAPHPVMSGVIGTVISVTIFVVADWRAGVYG